MAWRCHAIALTIAAVSCRTSQVAVMSAASTAGNPVMQVPGARAPDLSIIISAGRQRAVNLCVTVVLVGLRRTAI